MEDGITAIILIISVFLISFFFFVILTPQLILVFLLIAIVLLFLLSYTCLLVFTTKLDKNKVHKDWKKVEELEKIKKRFFDEN